MDHDIFRTERKGADDYHLQIYRSGQTDKVHVALSNGPTGMVIVLTEPETAALIDAIAALKGPTEKDKQAEDALPPHEVSTCGNAYLAAERALRAIEKATMLGHPMSADAIEQLHHLAHDAGASFNRIALLRDTRGGDDELPF